jgi:hypothetical protein
VPAGGADTHTRPNGATFLRPAVPVRLSQLAEGKVTPHAEIDAVEQGLRALTLD